MNIPFEERRPNRFAGMLTEKFRETMNEMIGDNIGAMDQRIMAVDGANFGVRLAVGCKVRVVFPERRAGRAHIG